MTREQEGARRTHEPAADDPRFELRAKEQEVAHWLLRARLAAEKGESHRVADFEARARDCARVWRAMRDRLGAAGGGPDDTARAPTRRAG